MHGYLPFSFFAILLLTKAHDRIFCTDTRIRFNNKIAFGGIFNNKKGQQQPTLAFYQKKKL